MKSVSTKVSRQDEDYTIVLRFESFGQKHEWTFEVNSGEVDALSLMQVETFAALYLEGSFAQNGGDEISTAFYLPKAAAAALREAGWFQ